MSGNSDHIDDTEEHPLRRSCIIDSLSFVEVENSPILPNIQSCRFSFTNVNEGGEVVFPNGDTYSGTVHGYRPQGTGKYVWSDGSVYQGEWKSGVIDGHGKMVWPSGAIYEGEFSDGYMHGIGTYTGCDQVTYTGEWRFGVKHGPGRKVFPNGDIFEGSWVEGVIEGSGKYIWSSGTVYVGNMKGGEMSGKGSISWINGDSFEGNWVGGLIHGFGVYTWANGGCYIGTWTHGLKDGRGAFYPKGANLPEVQQRYLTALRKGGPMPTSKQRRSTPISHAASVDSGPLVLPNTMESGHGSSANLSGGIDKLECARSLSEERHGSLKTSVGRVSDCKGSTAGEDVAGEIEVCADVPVLEREYVQGVLISEFITNKDMVSASRDASRRQKKRSKEIRKPGEAIIKGHQSYDLMVNLQLGIRYTVSKITPIERREIQESDFGHLSCFWMSFPRQGSRQTPPHRNLREMFKIDAADYMMSICGSDALRELSSPGKSGSVFFLSQDDRFMIKTLRKSEVNVLLHMLPDYHHHVQAYENTLITKFFGLHRIITGGVKFRFVVMGNMFCTELRIHRRFDLKGSSQGRSTNKVEIDENTTLKDLDLKYQFYLESSWRESLLKQIQLDCKFLEAQRIMDYSLLLGVHYRAPQYLKSLINDRGSEVPGEGSTLAEALAEHEEEISSYPHGLVLVPRRPEGGEEVFGPHIRGSRLRASAAGDKEVDLLLPGTARLHIQLGVNMPARAEPISQEDGDLFHEAYDVVLYVGIIDILQAYNLKKKMEHASKSLHFDSFSISSVKPSIYSQRFFQFIEYVFPQNT